MIDLFNYQRRKSSVAKIGNLLIGGENPIRVQSMTTTDTNDTQACVEQAERIVAEALVNLAFAVASAIAEKHLDQQLIEPDLWNAQRKNWRYCAVAY